MESKVSFRNLFTEPTKNGLTRPKRVRGSGVYMVNMGELFAHRRIGSIEMDRVPLSPAESSFLLQPGDLLFARQSLVLSGAGQCSIFLGHDEPVTFESHLIRCRINKAKADPRFLFYLFGSSVGRQILEPIIQQGAGASGLKASDLACVELPNVPLASQISIANCLSSLDDRIDHNRALAANLEAIARRLFKSWFVNFNPVRAKSNGEKAAGLDDDIAALFPDRFADDESGQIPAGWKVGTLADVCELNPETWSTKNHPDILEYIDLSDVKSGCIEEATSYHWEASPSRARRVLRCGDTIVGTVRPGNRSFALIAADGLTGSTGFAVLRPSHSHHREYLYLAATSDDAIERLAHLADGAAYPAVRPDVVTGTEVVIPNVEIMTQFSVITRPMFDQFAVCQSEASLLSSLRDLLLPRLISGKLRVADAESLIEEAIA